MDNQDNAKTLNPQRKNRSSVAHLSIKGGIELFAMQPLSIR